MRKFWFVMICITALAGLYVINSDGHNTIRVKVTEIHQTPEQYFSSGNPNLSILPEVKRTRKYAYAYTSERWFEKNREYLLFHPEDAVIMTSSGGSEPITWTVIFSDRSLPDQKFFRQ